MADGAEKRGWWLRGNFAPVTAETEAFDLPVKGAIPPELSGIYVRNGPNPPTGRSQHWFMGDGMLHGVRLEGGRARWYRSRYVQTTHHTKPIDNPMDVAALMDKTRSTANTSIVRHAGKLLALEEGHLPYEVSADLETLGWRDFGGKLTTALTAHPKICPETGEMLAFGYGVMPPYLTYHRFDAAGALVQSEEIPLPEAVMAHDFAATRTRVLFLDLPIVFDLPEAMAGRMPFRWSDSHPARIGVMPRTGGAADIRWFSIAPCYIFHVLNAYDVGDTVVMDAARYERLWARAGAFGDSLSKLHRYELNLATGAVVETPLDDMGIEFPRVADAVVGLPHRYGYAAEVGGASEKAQNGPRLYKFDLKTGARETCDFGPNRIGGEPVFAALGAGEDAGVLMTFVHDEAADESVLALVDARAPQAGPIAQIPLPARVPYGFHGGWFAD